MALPTPADLETLDYSYLGQPFCQVPAKSTVTLAGMDYSYLGQPFVSNEGSSGPEPPTISYIKYMSSIARANIKGINGIPLSFIKKVMGVENNVSGEAYSAIIDLLINKQLLTASGVNIFVVDSNPVENQNYEYYVGAQTIHGYYQCIEVPSDCNHLHAVDFTLQKTGTPVNTVWAEIYDITGTWTTDAAPTGSPLVQSNIVNMNDISTDYETIHFTFTSPLSVSAGQHYALVIMSSGLDNSNYCEAGLQTTPSHPGIAGYKDSVWNVFSPADCIFYLYGSVN